MGEDQKAQVDRIMRVSPLKSKSWFKRRDHLAGFLRWVLVVFSAKDWQTPSPRPFALPLGREVLIPRSHKGNKKRAFTSLSVKRTIKRTTGRIDVHNKISPGSPFSDSGIPISFNFSNVSNSLSTVIMLNSCIFQNCKVRAVVDYRIIVLIRSNFFHFSLLNQYHLTWFKVL